MNKNFLSDQESFNIAFIIILILYVILITWICLG